MVSFEEQNKILGMIGRSLKRKIECFALGGNAMLYYGIKESTKDIDLAFLRQEDREDIEEILRKNAFKEKSTFTIYPRNINLPVLLERDTIRFDLFLRKIIDFELSDNIIERIEKVYEFDNLIVKVISPEDIILFKCATERAGDRADAAAIVKNFDIDWNLIIEESLEQSKKSPYIFPVFLYGFLLELKADLGAEIPEDVLHNLKKIAEAEMLKRMKKSKKLKKRQKQEKEEAKQKSRVGKRSKNKLGSRFLLHVS